MSHTGRYQKILVPLDGTGWAQRALPHAVDLARSNPDAELILLTVYTPPAREFVDQLELSGQSAQTLVAREQLNQYLIGLRAELRSENVNVTIHMSEGVHVTDLICDYIQREGIDLVVMSTHGRTGIARWLFGSIARDVMERTDVPVLLIRPDKHE
jgi:nucleotide-binding universal stress UspA family protein